LLVLDLEGSTVVGEGLLVSLVIGIFVRSFVVVILVLRVAGKEPWISRGWRGGFIIDYVFVVTATGAR
jgi:hypothetical protein